MVLCVGNLMKIGTTSRNGNACGRNLWIKGWMEKSVKSVWNLFSFLRLLYIKIRLIRELVYK